MGPQSHEDPNYGNLDVAPMERHKLYYKGEGGGFPQVRAVVNFMSPKLPVARPNTKSAQTMHYLKCYLVCVNPSE
jgi:hypothetical protein